MSRTLVSLWSDVRGRLEAAGVDTPVLDARLLIEAGAGVERMDIVTDPRRMVDEFQVAAVDALTRRREAREPVSHIIGRKHFWTYEFQVTPDVLAPRQETELLVEAALTELAPDRPARVLDLGVGSGAILLTVLRERPLASGVGVDISAAALKVAEANAHTLDVVHRLELREGDWDATGAESFDLVLSNPPYIPSADIEGLQPEVSRYEPRAALDGGADGLEAYRAIIARLPGLLNAEAAFALELGRGQMEAVRLLAEAAGLTGLSARVDLGGVERVLVGRGRRG